MTKLLEDNAMTVFVYISALFQKRIEVSKAIRLESLYLPLPILSPMALFEWRRLRNLHATPQRKQ